MTPELMVLIALAAGALLGALHMAVLRWVLTRSVLRRSPRALLLTAPLRVTLPALGFLGAASLGGGVALAAALVGYVVTVQVVRWRALPRLEGDA